MEYLDYLIVGSGPAGMSAARKLEGPNTCIVDVGDEPLTEFPFHSLSEGLSSGRVRDLLGTQWEMLANLHDPISCHPKLRASSILHVMRGECFNVWGAHGEKLVSGRGSHAVGGMSNAWGAQLLRYTDDDLSGSGGWPIKLADLEPYYSDLEEHIGIAGIIDDMAYFLGPTSNMLPPSPIVPAAEYLLASYQKKRGSKRLGGLRLGRSRLAILTKKYQGRNKYDFGETEFFSTVNPGMYTARDTLASLLERGKVKYLRRNQVVGFKEYPEFVEVELEDLELHQRHIVRTRHLILGCGTIQTSKLVLNSRGQNKRSLPFIDHPPTLVPLFIPRMFGRGLPKQSFPVQLIGTFENNISREMISFYYPGAMLWSDLLPDIPLPLNTAMRTLKVLLSGMLVAQIWERSSPKQGNRLSLESDGTIRIDYTVRNQYEGLADMLASMRSIGALSLSRFASTPPPSWGFHHAGTLPMRINPGEFETHVDGRLWDNRRVRIIDGSVLPSLPSKNHSLTIMANAARVADDVKLCGY